MGLFGKSQPRTPAQNQAAKKRGDQQRYGQDRRARKLADKYEARVEKKRKH